MLNSEYFISLSDIFSYIGDGKRCLVEGEEVFKRKHIVCCGIRSRENGIAIFGLCLSTSSLHGKPHELHATRNGLDKTFNISCSCIAGSSKKCKHCIGLLLYLSTTKLVDLEDLSCTDMQQQWGKLKNLSKEMYIPVKISDHCHVKPLKTRCKKLSSDQRLQQEIHSALLGAAPNSALNIHIIGRGTIAKLTKVKTLKEIQLSNIVSSPMKHTCKYASLFEEMPKLSELPLFYSGSELNAFKLTIRKFNLESLDENCKQFYKLHVSVTVEQCIELCQETIDQSQSKKWKQERSKRITASECYGFYTFNGTDEEWMEKINRYFKNKFSGNSATRYGSMNEEGALLRYESVSSNEISKFGLVVNPTVPGLGFSPDGIVFEDNKPRLLVEIKCPTAGEKISIFELAKNKRIPYLTTNQEENYELRQRHKYYGQIQLGLALTGIPSAHLVCYSKIDNGILIVTVNRDEEFIVKLLEKLNWVYFTYFIPIMCKIQSQNRP